MTENQIVQFLQALSVKKIEATGNGWVKGCCPLAPWLHRSGHDHEPSFAVKINEGGHSNFNCFGCRSGTVEELVQMLEMYTRGQIHFQNFQLARLILKEELQVLPLPPYGESAPVKKFQEWPAWWLEQYLPAFEVMAAAMYLEKRKVPPEVAEHFKLRYDPHRSMIVCPYFTSSGKLAGARGRSILEGTTGWEKHWDYTFNDINNAGMVWYNEQALNLEGPVVTVEGQFDVMRVWQAYPKVVGALTAKPTLEKVMKLGYSPLVLHLPDTDATGHQSVLHYQKHCSKLQIPYHCIQLPPTVKDPDECHPEYLRTVIAEAVLY